MGAVVHYWTQLYEFFGKNDFWMIVVGSWTVPFVAVWVSNLFLLPIDLTGKPEWIVKYKVQPANTKPVDPQKVWGAIKTALFNQFVLSAPLGLVLYKVVPEGCCHPDNLPSGWIVLRDILAAAACVEVAFYYSHRLIHYGPLYKAVHKKHHEWTAPIGITAIYAHPFEFVVGNVFPVVIGPILMRSHMFTTWLWFGIALVSTTFSHSGYHLPFVPQSPQFHDFHHLKFNVNYGTFGLLDRLHGTDASFRRSVQFKRHRRLFRLTPIHELYPDDKTKKQMQSG